MTFEFKLNYEKGSLLRVDSLLYFNDIEKICHWEYKPPTNLTDVKDNLINLFKYDFDKVSKTLGLLKTEVAYKIDKLQPFKVASKILSFCKQYYTVTLIAVSTIGSSGIISNMAGAKYDNPESHQAFLLKRALSDINDSNTVAMSYTEIKEHSTQKAKRRNLDKRKKIAEKKIKSTVKEIKIIGKEMNTVTLSSNNRFWKTIANDIPSGTYVGKFTDNSFKVPITEQHKRIAVVYNFFKKHEKEYKINALAATAQFSIETANGQSKLCNMGNNPAGIKEMRKNFPFLRAKDDGNDLDETGNSRFRKYYSIEDGLKDYMGSVISKPLYKNVRANYKNTDAYIYHLQRLAWDKRKGQWVRYADNNGYESMLKEKVKSIKKLLNVTN